MNREPMLEDLGLFGFDEETEKLMKILYSCNNEFLRSIPRNLLNYELAQMAEQFDKEEKFYTREIAEYYTEDFLIKREQGVIHIEINSVDNSGDVRKEETVTLFVHPDGKAELTCTDPSGREDYRFRVDEDGVRDFCEVSSIREK